MKCEECGEEVDKTILGACKQCAEMIINKMEKKIKYKKNRQDSEF